MIDSASHGYYAEWRWRSVAVWVAYDRWRAGRGDRALEFAEYRVALDLEERACRRYMETMTA